MSPTRNMQNLVGILHGEMSRIAGQEYSRMIPNAFSKLILRNPYMNVISKTPAVSMYAAAAEKV